MGKEGRAKNGTSHATGLGFRVEKTGTYHATGLLPLRRVWGEGGGGLVILILKLQN